MAIILILFGAAILFTIAIIILFIGVIVYLTTNLPLPLAILLTIANKMIPDLTLFLNGASLGLIYGTLSISFILQVVIIRFRIFFFIMDR